ncbi:MAG: hypothetical protein Q9200_004856, partial [Gallowayella weberi]
MPSAAVPTSTAKNPPPPHPHVPKSPDTTRTAPSTTSPLKPQPGPSKPIPASLKFAAEVRKRATSVTETYIAYGVCERLVQECAKQADYTIPQRYEKNGVIPKGAKGEDLG